MKIAQSVILLSLLSVFFLGNIGVNVFKHICEEDGVSISYIVNRGEEHCGSHEKHAELPPCCHADKEKAKDDCCDDEVYYYKLQVDAEQIAVFDFQLLGTLVELPGIFYAEYTPLSEECIVSNFEDPPPISGKDILLFKQVWNL